MKAIDSLRFRLGALFQRSRMNAELEEELHSHMEHRADDLERAGLTRPEAERRARVEFGGREKYKEVVREAAGGDLFETLFADLRYSVRVLRKSPGFLMASVLTLALAIGANAVTFGILNAIILRPLNVPQPQTLYSLERGPGKDCNESYPDYIDLRDRNRSFDAIALYDIVTVGLDTGNNPTQSMGYEVSGNYFDALRMQPYLGRFFHGADERGPNSAPYLVISYAYWHSHFQDDRAIVGRVVLVNKHPFTIVGVAPREFQGTLIFFFPDYWIPAVDHELITGTKILDQRSNQNFIMTLGHIKDGVTPAQAIADLNSVGAWLEKTYPKDDAHMTFVLARPSLAGDLLGPPVRGFIVGLTLLAGLILLAACANLGSLFAARSADRSREIALRLALGSSRKRILRGVFTEAVLISLLGGAVGLMGSLALLRELSVWHPIEAFPIRIPVDADATVYVFALLLAIASGLLFGAVPVRQILRTNPYETVKAGSTGIVAGGMGRRVTVRDILLVAQIAICAVLVTSSLVAVRGLLRSMHSSFGFQPENTMLVDTSLSMAGFSGDRVIPMQRRMIEAMQTIPGIKAAGFVDNLPLGGGYGSMGVFADEATDFSPSKQLADVMRSRVSPDYFRAAGTALLQGRDFNWRDDDKSARVAVINEEFARKIFGATNATMKSGVIGRYFKSDTGQRIQVIGIVQNGKYYQLTEDQQPAMYLSFMQSTSSSTRLVVRSDRAPEELASAMRGKLRGLDAALPFDIHTWTQELGLALFPARVATIALGMLGGMGTVLAVTGIFGMAAYSVSKRLRELGIRMALGARRKEVLSAALGRPVKLLAFGSFAGLILGVLATRVLAHIVFDANPRDPLVLGGVVLVMALLGLLATWIPAQRALSVDPMMLLRED